MVRARRVKDIEKLKDNNVGGIRDMEKWRQMVGKGEEMMGTGG